MNIEELERLNELKEKGILTKAEFDAKKKELLDGNVSKNKPRTSKKKGHTLKIILAVLLVLLAIPLTKGITKSIKNYTNSSSLANMMESSLDTKPSEKIAEKHTQDIIIGNPNGSITLEVYFDFFCGYSQRAYQNAISPIVNENKDLKVVLKPIGFVAPLSEQYAKLLLASKQQGRHREVMDMIFLADSPRDEKQLYNIFNQAGVDVEKLKSDANSNEIGNQLGAIANDAQKFNVVGVPTMIINGKTISTIDKGMLEDAINNARNGL